MASGFVGRVHRWVVGVRRVVIVDEVGVGGIRLERLVCVADSARHEDRTRWVELDGEHGPERWAGAQVDPRAEYPSGRHRDELVPGLGVDAARGARWRR